MRILALNLPQAPRMSSVFYLETCERSPKLEDTTHRAKPRAQFSLRQCRIFVLFVSVAWT
jgi:hypothetical protein